MTSQAQPPAKAPPVVHTGGFGNSILVNTCQRGNPVLEQIRNIAKEWSDIVPDFQVGRTTCVLFLSLKYHRLHPEYIHQRIQKLAHMYSLRYLLIHCDITEHQDSLRELTKVCLINNLTVIVAWSAQECGLYLSTMKAYEHKPPTAIKERVDKDHMSILRAALTSIRSVNKTDVTTLKTTFSSFAGISRATQQQLINCPGIGQTKARRLRDAFNAPFHNRPVDKTLDHFTQSQSQTQTSTQPVASSSKQPARQPSPVWTIEQDVSDDEEEAMAVDAEPSRTQPPDTRPLNPNRPSAPDDDEEEREAPLNPRKRGLPRSASPVWDIELDLNDDDDPPQVQPLNSKRPRLDSDSDSDSD